MNPIVEKMLSLTNEVQTLEQIFADECHCESRYHESPCSTHVVARLLYACEPTRSPLVCEVVLQETLMAIEQEMKCRDCWKPVEKCWTIQPI